MTLLVLGSFVLMLVVCIIFNISILYALGGGFVLFFVYTLVKGFTFRETLGLALKGVSTIRNILITFILIGMLTGLWRASGTIASVVCYAVNLITPSIFILMTFLLNAMMSYLTGTAFGTAATMGAVTVTMGNALGVNPVMLGGAMLSGAYFGDRCSPVSTSALLVSELTHTDIWKNIKQMIKNAIVPFVLACIAFTVMGYLSKPKDGSVMDVSALFGKEFSLGIIPLIPAFVVLVLSLFKVKVKLTLASSVIAAIIVCLAYQKMDVGELFSTMFFGYEARHEELTSLMNGGGILSMVRVAVIVSISSSFSEMLRANGLLDSVKELIARRAQRGNPFAVVLPTAILSACISCNQTLTIILTKQLCEDAVHDESQLAMFIEDSAVVVSPLIPWSIAGVVALDAVGAPLISIVAACYMYLLPLWRLVVGAVKGRSKG